MKKESLQSWSSWELKALFANLGLGLMSKWFISPLACIMAAFIWLKVKAGYTDDPRYRPVDLKKDEKKFARLALKILKRNSPFSNK